MQYVVKIQYARGPETPLAEFKFLNDAKIFIEMKLQADAALNVKTTYLLCDFDEIMDKLGPNRMAAPSEQEHGSQGQGQGQGQSQSASFRPTPFNMTPRPSGTPPNWMKDDKDDDKKDK